MQALILAGGAGTRLRPLTHTVPKPVLPLAGRPHIAYVIDWLRGHGVDDVVISCGHLAEGIRAAQAEIEGVRVRYAEEPDARGTAGAIKFAEELLEDRFVVINGDILCDLDLGAQIEQHERTGARATIALYPVEDPSAYGLVRRRPDGAITDFLEKPTTDQIDTDEINAGTYVLERSVLELIPPSREISIEREVFPKLVGEGLYGRRLEGYWIDIGTPERFLQASWDILEGRVETAVGERLDRRGNLIESDVEVGDAVIEPPALISAGVVLSPGAKIGPRAVLGSDCVIAQRATVAGSVLLPRCQVGADATLREAILAAGVEVADGVVLEPGAVIGEGELVGVAA
jgi:mannose-1-phosphate guanylyltransferase